MTDTNTELAVYREVGELKERIALALTSLGEAIDAAPRSTYTDSEVVELIARAQKTLRGDL